MRNFREQLAIDKAANGERIVLTKRASAAAMTAEQCLKESLMSGFEDPDIDLASWLNQQVEAYGAHVGKRVVPFKKGATEMDVSTQTLVAIAKGVIERGASPIYEKHVYIGAIAALADEIKKAGESTAQAFTRAITQDESGRVLYQCLKFAKGPEVEPFQVSPNGTAASPWPTPGPSSSAAATKIPPWAGPNHARMQSLADDHLAANPRKSPASAYAAVYTDPRNLELRQAVVAEHHQAILGAGQLDGARTGLVG
jgi:hypothetical protein